MSGTSFTSLSIGTGESVIRLNWEERATISRKSERDEGREEKQKVVVEKVEMGFEWRRGESEDESRGAPHVPYITSH